MTTAPKQTDWSRANWHRSDTALAKHFGVTRQAVSAARKNHSELASPKGHGGSRPGAGRPRKK